MHKATTSSGSLARAASSIDAKTSLDAHPTVIRTKKTTLGRLSPRFTKSLKVPAILASWSADRRSPKSTASQSEASSQAEQYQNNETGHANVLTPAKNELSSWVQNASEEADRDARVDHLVSEPPLRRPSRESIPTPHEQPLQRPDEAGAISTTFAESTVTIAMDMSGSTEGRVLEQEVKAAQSLADTLSAKARLCARVLPWDHRLRNPVSLDSIEDIKCLSGGTIPSVLTSTTASRKMLADCSCWLLFTDGEIESSEIQRFSNAVCNEGLHGTTCIIVTFGYKSRRPISCNISVGLSVFGATADCLFLFHDIDTEDVYILQTKGIFNKLLPPGRREIVFDHGTKWEHLPKMGYHQLGRVRIPEPRKLSPGDLLLQSKRTVRLQDIFDDKLDAATTSEIVDNDDNLKSLLLSSHIRGHDKDVKKWIQKQKMTQEDILYLPRLDLESQASLYVQMIVTNLQPGTPESATVQRGILQEKLRAAHARNWGSFVSNTAAHHEKTSHRNLIVDVSMNRMAVQETEIFKEVPTPNMLSPVSPTHHPDSERRIITSPASRSPNAVPKPCTDDFEDLYTVLPDTDAALEETDVLYIPGYRYERGSTSTAGFEGRCPVCDSPDTVLAVLLKRPPSTHNTAGFPKPNSRSGLVFPLAMGTFPETDILSPFVCCDACAYHLVQLRTSPYNEEITAAIPLIPEAISGKFRDTTFTVVDEALQKRFERPALEQVLLAVLYSTMETLEGEFKTTVRDALHWMAYMLSLECSLPPTLSVSFGGHLSPRGYIRLPMALSQSLADLPKPGPILLQYPLGGFVVMTQSMIELNLEPKPNARQSAVFQRILYHLAEKHHMAYQEDSKGAESFLKDLIFQSPKATEDCSQELIPVISTPIIALRDSHLLSEEEWDLLQRLGSLFDRVKDDYTYSLAVFLHFLHKETTAESTAAEFFDRLRARNELNAIFSEPEAVHEQMAQELISDLGISPV